MQIRMLQPGEEMQLARMKWLHCQEDDRDYGEHNLDGADYATFAAEFTAFLRAHPKYRVYVAAQGDTLAAAMFCVCDSKGAKARRARAVHCLPDQRVYPAGMAQSGRGHAAAASH